MKRVIVCFLIVGFGLLLKGCNTTEPPVEKAALLLKLEDASCSEAWITLTTTNLPLPATITLKQNNAVRKTLNLTTADTLLYIDSLLPNTSYAFYTAIQSYNQTSNELSVTTMDTTSHNFTFETWTFGYGITQSIFYDVAIINENNIWAVGEIKISDTTGSGYTMYNAAHWSGTDWTLHRIMFYTFCGQQHQNAYPASSIFAFSESDIWVGMRGDQIAKIENGTQTQTICMPWSFVINKIWGSSSNDLFVVGNTGNIARYQSGSWQSIGSGTELPLLNIYGNLEGNIYTCGGHYSTGESVLLKLRGYGTPEKIIEGFYENKFDSTKLFISQLYGVFKGLWIDEEGRITMGGNLIYRYRSSRWSYAQGIKGNNIVGGGQTRGFIHSISGNYQNDFCIAGEYGTIQHFNGYKAIQIGEGFSFQSEYDFYGSDMKNDCIVVVGRKSLLAAIRVFKRG